MKEYLERLTEKTIFDALRKNNPELLAIIKAFTERGYDSDRIVDICAASSGHSTERLAIIGVAADYLIDNPELITHTIQ